MSRLVDYFVICGYEHTEGGRGRVLQRFPACDREDVSFIQGLDLFCQPGGWVLTPDRQETKFFMPMLTDSEGDRRYCPCLSFSEPLPLEEEDGMMFAPKCLVLVSRHDMRDTFRDCLRLIYGALYTNHPPSVTLESLVARLLVVTVPAPASPAAIFSLGAGDRQLVSGAAQGGTRVAALFRQLGPAAVMTLVSAVISEQRILLHSASCALLTDSAAALASLISPLHYCHTLVPVLPRSMLEILSSPAPFIIGVTSQLRRLAGDLQDQGLVVVDLDHGRVDTPATAQLPGLTEPLRSSVEAELCLVLHPQLATADLAFPESDSAAAGGVAPQLLDKQLRAVMLRMMAQLLQVSVTDSDVSLHILFKINCPLLALHY